MNPFPPPSSTVRILGAPHSLSSGLQPTPPLPSSSPREGSYMASGMWGGSRGGESHLHLMGNGLRVPQPSCDGTATGATCCTSPRGTMMCTHLVYGCSSEVCGLVLLVFFPSLVPTAQLCPSCVQGGAVTLPARVRSASRC